MNWQIFVNFYTRIKLLRRQAFGSLIVGLLSLLLLWPSLYGQALDASRLAIVRRVESVGFTVSDLDKAIDFYTRILPFVVVSDNEIWGDGIEHLTGVFGARVRIVRLRLGDSFLELTEYLTAGGRPIPIDSRSNDGLFQHIAIIVSDMDEAYRILRLNKVRHASTGPQTLPKTIPNAAGISAFYFKDFDGHVLEILHFPPDKGAKKWHDLEKSGNVFLGIDHTAIVVGDTARSLKFYRDILGLTVAGESENFGSEQEHLNNVFGARLHITGLRTNEEGIAVEFLEYVAPTDGKPFPGDTRSNDFWHWQISFVVPKADDMALVIRQNRFKFISSGVVFVGDQGLGFGKGFLVRDPDGHAVRVVEK